MLLVLLNLFIWGWGQVGKGWGISFTYYTVIKELKAKIWNSNGTFLETNVGHYHANKQLFNGTS